MKQEELIPQSAPLHDKKRVFFRSLLAAVFLAAFLYSAIPVSGGIKGEITEGKIVQEPIKHAAVLVAVENASNKILQNVTITITITTQKDGVVVGTKSEYLGVMFPGKTQDVTFLIPIAEDVNEKVTIAASANSEYLFYARRAAPLEPRKPDFSLPST